MAARCISLQYGDETARPLFGLSFPEAVVVVLAYQGVHHLLGSLGHNALALVPAVGVYLLLLATHHVRSEPYGQQIHAYLLRRVLGQPKRSGQRAYSMLEVDGFTREALTEEEQSLRLISHLQTLIASLGKGGVLQFIAQSTSQTMAEAQQGQDERGVRASGRTDPRLSELARRSTARLEAGTARQSDIHFYIVVYEGTRRRPLPLPHVVRRALSIPLPGEQDAEDEIALGDLVSGVHSVLATMNLSARPVTGLAVDYGTVTRETPWSVALSGGLHAASLYMLLPPGVTDPGFLDPIVALDGPVRVSVWIEGLDPEAERNRLSMRQRQNSAGMIASMTGGTRPTADDMAAVGENDELLLRLRRPDQGIVRGGVYITCFGASAGKVERAARRAQSVLRRRLAARAGTGLAHQTPLYLATQPGADTADRRWRMHAETAANTYLFNRRNPTTLRGYIIGQTAGGEVVRFDPTDESLRNALCVTVGLSGMGKTMMTLKLLKMHLLSGGRSTILDRSGHYGLLGSLVGAATVRTPAELDAAPIGTQMVIVDLRQAKSVSPELLEALDRRTQTVVGDKLHLFILEEAWQLEHMGAALWVNELARRGRHWAGFVWWITHEPEDLLRHPEIRSMFAAAATKFIFALDDRDNTASRIGAALGATPREIDMIKGLPVGECYVMRHNKQRGSVTRGQVHIMIDPDEAWLFETDPRTWQYQRRAVEISLRSGDVWRAIQHLSDTLPFNDSHEDTPARPFLLEGPGTLESEQGA